MARSTTEGIYASSLQKDSSLYPQCYQHYNHSSSHQPARQDTGLTQNLPGSQQRPLALDLVSPIPPRSYNTSSIDDFFKASTPAGWPSSFTSSFYNTTTLASCLDRDGDARQQQFRRHAAAFIASQRSETTLSRRTPPTTHNNTTASPFAPSLKSRSRRQPSSACVRTQRKNQQRWNPLGRTTEKYHNTASSPPTQPEDPTIKIEDEYESQSEPNLSLQTPDRHMNTAATFSSPAPQPGVIYISIEHDDEHDNEHYNEHENQSELDLIHEHPDTRQTSTAFERSPSPFSTVQSCTPSVEYQDQSESVTSRQTPEEYLPTAAKPTTTTFQRSRVNQSPSPAPSITAAECQPLRRGSNKRPNDVAFSSLPAELIQRAAKRQRAGDIPEADEPQSLNSCSQALPFLSTQQTDKRSHDEAFHGTNRSESVPCQAPKKRRTQDFKTIPSQSSPSPPGRQPTRFRLRDFLRKKNRQRAATLPEFQYDGAADMPSANTHVDHEREASPDSLFDDDESSPELDQRSGEREASPDSLFDEEECSGQDNTPDAGVTLPDSSSIGGECPPGQEPNPPANPPQTTTAPVEAQGTNEPAEVAACGPADFSAGFRAFLGHQSTDKYVSPYAEKGETRADVPPTSLHVPSVEAATTREKGRLDGLVRQVATLTNERNAARKKVEQLTFVEPTAGKTREQKMKAESLQLKRALRAQAVRTMKAQSEVEEWKRKYDTLASAHNQLLARHSALLNLSQPVAPPPNQVWQGPSQDGSRPVGGPALSSSQRRPMPSPRQGADGRRAVANPQPERVNVVDLTGEDVGAATQPQSSNPRPTLPGVPSPTVAVPSVATNASAAPAPVPALVPAPGVPAARVANAPPPAARHLSRPASANANASAKQAPEPVPATTTASIPPVNNVVPQPARQQPQPQPAAPPGPSKSMSPEAEELNARFRNKDYGWLSTSGSGFNHMKNRFQKPAFGLNCSPPVPTPKIEVPASRFLRQERERTADVRAAARAAAKARLKAKRDAAGRSATADSASPSLDPVAEGADDVGGSNGAGVGDEELGCDFDELAREMEEECARATEEREAGVQNEEEEGGGEPGFTDEQIARMIEEELESL